MKFLIVSMVLAVAQAGVIPTAGHVEQEVIPGIANEHIVQGPSTKTRLLGPDGSQVNSDAAGGTIVPEGGVAVVQPVLALTKIVEPVQIAPVASVPVVAPIAVPAAVQQAIVEFKPAALIAAAGKSIEDGQYIPDNTEKLYDDGSYKASPLEEADDGSYKGEQ